MKPEVPRQIEIIEPNGRRLRLRRRSRLELLREGLLLGGLLLVSGFLWALSLWPLWRVSPFG